MPWATDEDVRHDELQGDLVEIVGKLADLGLTPPEIHEWMQEGLVQAYGEFEWPEERD